MEGEVRSVMKSFVSTPQFTEARRPVPSTRDLLQNGNGVLGWASH